MKIICWDEISKFEESGDKEIVTEFVDGKQVPAFVELGGNSIGILEVPHDPEDHYVFDPPTPQAKPAPYSYYVHAGAWSFTVDGNIGTIQGADYEQLPTKPTSFKAWFRRNYRYVSEHEFNEVVKRLELSLTYQMYKAQAFE